MRNEKKKKHVSTVLTLCENKNHVLLHVFLKFFFLFLTDISYRNNNNNHFFFLQSGDNH